MTFSIAQLRALQGKPSEVYLEKLATAACPVEKIDLQDMVDGTFEWPREDCVHCGATLHWEIEFRRGMCRDCLCVREVILGGN